ncbi:guanylate kinase [Xylariaceae sp. FL1272]|nr:guanylate kinase [Xylariaceae sp. FL1272]
MTSTPLRDLRPVVISGPSGVGKGTLIDMISNAHPGTFGSTVSHTTRERRNGEVEGVNYYYVSPSDFSLLVSQNAFAEHTSYSGHFYGTSKQTIADQAAKGLVAILDIEMHGVKQMKASLAVNARYVFIKPPSFEALESRLRSRGTENEEQIQKRLARARVELEYANTPGVHDLVIVNDDLDKAYRELDGFIFGQAV